MLFSDKIVKSKIQGTLVSITSRLVTENLVEIPFAESLLSSSQTPQEREQNTQQDMHPDGDDPSSEDESIHQFSDPESMTSHE